LEPAIRVEAFAKEGYGAGEPLIDCNHHAVALLRRIVPTDLVRIDFVCGAAHGLSRGGCATFFEGARIIWYQSRYGMKPAR